MLVHQFKFTGIAKEYFGIWIVNLFLSIVTSGIYLAWAKVRRLRYFYANTYLDGHNFDYHARPISILIGRLIVLAVLLVYNLLVTFFPLAGLLIVPYLFLLPWVINKAIRFRARVTSYRTVRFNFGGTYWRAFLVFTIMPVVGAATLGLLWPLASRMASNYIGNNLRYGTAQFSTNAKLGALYKNMGAGLGFFVLLTLVFAILSAVSVLVFSGGEYINELMESLGYSPEDSALFAAIVFGVIGLYIAVVFTFFFVKAGVRNVAYNGTLLDGRHQFRSNISRFRYVWILISNLFVSLLTLGLMRPWTALRSWRYQVQCTSLEADGDLGLFIAQRVEEGAAAGSEFLDIEGIDFGL